MTKRPVARLALSCLLSWSMIMSGYMPAAWAFAEEASEAPVAAQGSQEPAQDGSPQDEGAGEDAADEGQADQTDQAGSTDQVDPPGDDAQDDGAADTDQAAEDTEQPSQDASADAGTESDGDAAGDSSSQGGQDSQGSQAASTESDGKQDAVDAQASQDASAAEAPTLAPEDALSLVYIAESSIEQGQTQQVAILLSDGSAQVSTACLTLQAPDGQVAVDAASGDGSGMLFNIDTASLAQGTTTLVGLALTYADGTAATVDLTRGQAAYAFEVGAPAESSGTDEDDAITAYTIDDDGELVEAGSLDEALAASGAQDAMTNALMAASDDEASAQSASTGLVIALDPGHDNQSPGATGYGLYEEDLNLAIAQACRDELKTYPGVTVYMTRSDSGDCPYYTDGNHVESECLKRRVQDAAAAGATIFVSIHINSSDASSAHGVEVWYPSYNAGDTSITADGQKLAESIQKRLVALGLTDRGAKSNDTYTDDNGVERDYYSIIRNSKALSMPGVIIEHAFITSGTDYAFLSNSSTLKQMGIADATGIANFLGLSKSKDNSNVTLTRLTVADTDGKLGQATLRATGVTGAKRYYAQVKYYDGTVDTVEFGQTDEGVWFGTYDFAKAGRVAENVTITGYKVDASGATTQVGSWEGQLKRFSDIEVGAWYIGYVGDVASSGIITGYTDADGVTRTFGPDDTLTRGQVATMLWRLAGSPSASGTNRYSDVPSDQFYSTAVQWASEKGIVNGDKDAYGNLLGTFRPNDSVTREEFATMLYRYATKAGFGSGSGNIWSFPDAGNVQYYAVDAMAWCNAKGIITGDLATNPARLNPQSTATRAQAAKMMSVFAGCSGGKTPTETVVNVTSLSYRLSDEAKGVTFYTAAGEVPSSGSVSVKVWKKDNTSSVATYKASYVSSSSGENGDLVGRWAVTVPLSKMSSGDYVAQVWAASDVSGAEKAFVSTEVSTKLHPIMNSKSSVTASVLVKAYKASGATYPSDVYKAKGAATIEDFCKILVNEAKAEGVDPGVVFVQAMTETAWLRFGGDVKAEQCNFAGIGATGGGVKGATFSSVTEGLRAQVQHLRLYADATCTSAAKLSNTLVDPRFFTSLAGVSPYVEGLGSRWASGSSYGWGLAAMLDEL